MRLVSFQGGSKDKCPCSKLVDDFNRCVQLIRHLPLRLAGGLTHFAKQFGNFLIRSQQTRMFLATASLMLRICRRDLFLSLNMFSQAFP